MIKELDQLLKGEYKSPKEKEQEAKRIRFLKGLGIKPDTEFKV